MNYQFARILMKFVNTSMALEVFLKAIENNDNVAVQTQNFVFTKEELDHENAHVEAWASFSVKSSIKKDTEGYPFVEPDERDLKEYIEKNQTTKEQFLAMFKTVVEAPLDIKGLDLDGTDALYSKILNRQIKTEEDLIAYRIGKAS